MTFLEPKTKLSRALDLHPDVLPYVISLNPHDFERLNNPLMRQLMPPRITLARLAEMVDLPVKDLITGIYSAAHVDLEAVDLSQINAVTPALPHNAAEPPPWLDQEVVETIDLLEADERLDTDPFVPLFPALKRAEVGDVLLMKHKWEPQPLYDVWQKLEVDYFAVQQSPDEWWIYLRKNKAGFRAGR